MVTAILYLNGDWQPAHGGALRMYGVGSPAISTDADSSEPFVEVEPRRGTLAIFWSHLIPHEVLPASVARFAISLWMSVDASRRSLMARSPKLICVNNYEHFQDRCRGHSRLRC